MSTFLVTGGTGFIGRWVVADLVARGHGVRVFDLAPNHAALDDIAPGLSARVEFVSGDIADGSVRTAARGCTGIAHLVGLMTVDAIRDPVRAATVNLVGSLHAFEAARDHGIGRFAYVSSAAVFGSDDPERPYPVTHYGAQKLAIEGSARAYLRDHGIPSVGLRPFIVYGPGQSSGIAAGPSIAIAAALRDEASTIRFSGRVGFVHVFDVAACLVASLLSPMEGARAFTLCGETAEMSAFVAALRARVPGARVPVDGPPLPIPVGLTTSALPDALAAVPVTGLADGIDATVKFYRDRWAKGTP